MSSASKQAVRKPKKAVAETTVPNAIFPVVAIGASAGGLEAYKEFFHALPSNTGMAFVLVQHLDPTHQSLLTQIIAKATRMPVEEVKSGMRIAPGRVYVIPPNAFMALSADVFTLTPRTSGANQHLAVNFFMRSLAESRGGSAIGIILSGTGADGTLGLENIKAEGGITFAQEPETAKYDGMPRSAVSSGCVDFVLPPKGIAKELDRLHRHPYIAPARIESFSDESLDFRQILSLLRKASGVDFSNYKPNTIHRRALRRTAVLKLNSLSDYVKYLKSTPEEREKLYEDVLIPVTSFFRDLEVFETLKTQVYPEILKNKNGKEKTIRMWAPGCSTGEETYSLAMTLLEFLGDKAPSFQIQIFGTDLNEKGIQKARTGIYRESIAEEISLERLERFFVKVDDGYRVAGMVRDLCIFARQNLITDPPFSQMDVVACRNLLIYIQPVLQKSIIPILHYALKPVGYLVLGTSESVAAFPELFAPVDKKHKIYLRKAVISRLPLDFARPYIAGALPQFPNVSSKGQETANSEKDVQAEADRLVLTHHAPAGVIINSALEIVQFRGRTAPYLEPAPGKPSINVLKLAHSALAIELRSLVNAAIKKHLPVEKTGIAFEDERQNRVVSLSVTPLGAKDAEGPHYLILFDEAPSHDGRASSGDRHEGKKERQGKPETNRLRRELALAQDALRSSIESEDALREEFQSANEEILSANEELQSTNEELETSKEELQSTNEELNTVNEELRNRNTELSQSNNDLSNVLDAIRIPVLIVGPDLRIRRVTSAAADVFNLLPSDIGRPMTDIRHNLDVPDIGQLIHRTLAELIPVQQDVRDDAGRWRRLEIRPYRTAENRIEGAIVALPDINRLKTSEQYLRQIIDNIPNPILVLDKDLKILLVNPAFCTAFHISQADVTGKLIYQLDQWDVPEFRELLEEVLPQHRQVREFPLTHTSPTLGKRDIVVSGRRIEGLPDGGSAMVLLSIEDITERRFSEEALIKAEKLAASGRLAAALAHEINNPLQAVTNVISLLDQSQDLNRRDHEYVQMASRALHHVTHLTRQSLSFYREPIAPVVVNVQEVLESVLALYDRQLSSKKITVTKRFRVRRTVEGYPAEMRQIFSTLLTNAIEAVPQGGKITLHARDCVKTKKSSAAGVLFSLADNGPGIPSETRNRIFEPFFTTKGEQGTGLGLWVTQAIIHRLGGSIRFRSKTGSSRSSTCFHVFLPSQSPPGKVT